MPEKRPASVFGTCVHWDKDVQYDGTEIIYHPDRYGSVFFPRGPIVGTGKLEDLLDKDKFIESDAYDVLAG